MARPWVTVKLADLLTIVVLLIVYVPLAALAQPAPVLMFYQGWAEGGATGS